MKYGFTAACLGVGSMKLVLEPSEILDYLTKFQKQQLMKNIKLDKIV